MEANLSILFNHHDKKAFNFICKCLDEKQRPIDEDELNDEQWDIWDAIEFVPCANGLKKSKEGAYVNWEIFGHNWIEDAESMMQELCDAGVTSFSAFLQCDDAHLFYRFKPDSATFERVNPPSEDIVLDLYNEKKLYKYLCESIELG
jgi:hypothetical protein